MVSRQHRVIVSSRITRRIFGTQGVMTPAVKLTEFPGIYVKEKHPDIIYFHILLDCHEAIRAEGVHGESLYPGDEAKNTFSTATLNEISTIFPGFFGSQPIANLAMPTANGRFATNLIQRHVKNRMPLQDPVYTNATGDSPLDDRQLWTNVLYAMLQRQGRPSALLCPVPEPVLHLKQDEFQWIRNSLPLAKARTRIPTFMVP